MEKDIKGEELGKGISQESSGLYLARFVDWFGKKNINDSKSCKNAEIKGFIGENIKNEIRNRYYETDFINVHISRQMPLNADS